VGNTHASNLFQRRIGNTIERPAAILLAASPGLSSHGKIAEMADKKLVDDRTHSGISVYYHPEPLFSRTKG
jgi:hypothetical protein